MSFWKALRLFPLIVCAIIAVVTAFPATRVTTFRRGRPSILNTAADVVSADAVSSPESLLQETLLQGPQQSLLEEVAKNDRKKLWKRLEREVKVRARESSGSNTGMGFGGASKKTKGTTKERATTADSDHMLYDPNVDKKSCYGAVVMDQGVARINSVLSDATVASLLDYINALLEESQNPTRMAADMEERELYAQQTRFSDVLGKLNRWDMLLPLEESPEVMQALYELLIDDDDDSDNTAMLADTIRSILGPAPQLYELGTLISDPGSERQLLHADYNYQPDFTPVVPPALTCFVALQDIAQSMGPTTFLPQSATARHHQEILADDNENPSADSSLLATSPNQLNTLGRGDCSIYNPMLLHCGGANRSDQRRVIFYFSFKNPKFDEKDWPLAYASLSPDLRARGLTLPEIDGILKEWKKKTITG